MHYHEFETAFESHLQTHVNLYPHAVEYHRARFNQTIQYLLSSILEQTDTLIQQPETNWAHTEEIVSDILYCGEITVEQLFALEIPTQLTADKDFEAVKTKLYETKYYPISEHLNYISFPPALERKAFIGKHLDYFKEKSRFCDLGFGPGVLTAFILQQNASWQADGVDISQHCLQHAQRLLKKRDVLGRSELSVEDVRSLPYSDDTFDVVIAVEVLEHIPDPETGLSEAMRVLKPGGYAITALPVQLPLLMHLYDFDSPDEVLALYKKVGLKVVDFETKEFQRLSLFRNLSGALSFPPLILTLNIIVPYSIGILGYLLFKFVLMQNKLDLFRYFFKSNFQKTALLEKLFSLLVFIGIGSTMTYLLQRFGWEPDRFLHLVLVLVAFTFIQKFLSLLPKTPVYYAVVSFVCLWLAVQATPSVPMFLSGFAFFLGLYLIVFVIAKQLVLSLASIALDKAVDVNGLQVGMIPAEQVVRVEQPDGTIRYEKKQVEFSSGQDDNIVISPDPSGLTTEEIAQLQDLAAEGVFAEFGNRITVQPSIRFAPVISIGALLTALCQGPFYLKLMQLL